MDPVTQALAAITAGFQFGIELLKFLQTDQGKKLVEQSLNDRKEWDKFWAPVFGGMNADLMQKAINDKSGEKA